MNHEGFHPGKDPRSFETFNRDVEELLLSGDRVGEGGKAVIVRLSSDRIAPELRPVFERISEESLEDSDGARHRAVKLFKLYLPNKGKNEFEMHRKVYDLLQSLPEEERDKEYATVPRLSSSYEVAFDADMKKELEERFSLSSISDRSMLITMEYVDGEDLATVFYKWILEREGRTSEQTDGMDFKQLYEELEGTLRLERVPVEDIDAPQEVLDMAEWKASARNTEKIYTYLRKYRFPMSPNVAARVEKTLMLMHSAHMTHGDAFERNIMLTGGMKALREKGTLEDETTYLIDFGETRDRFVPEVDDFNVVRRLKTLSVSKEEERKREDEAKLGEISAKAELLRNSARWRGYYEKTKALLGSEDPAEKGKALAYAWNTLVPGRESAIEDFFIIAKDLLGERLVDRTTLDAFIAEHAADHRTAYGKNLIKRCSEWLNAE